MNISISTPIILFPAISLILLAYTEKFVQLARLTRSLRKQYRENKSENLAEQIKNLRKRIYLIRNMQAFGTGSFFLCIASIFLIFTSQETSGRYTFWLSMILLMIALCLALKEILLSSVALKLALGKKVSQD